MVAYYAARAVEYERIYQKSERQDALRELRGFVERALARAHVFEVACGTGYWTEIAARTAASIVATDINEEVPAIAHAKPIDARKVTFRKEDAYALPRLPQHFTAGLAAFGWSHVPKTRLQEFLRGFHAVLSPGAQVLFIDNVYVEGSSTPVSRTDEQGNTYQLRRLDDGSTHEVLKNFPAEQELRATVTPFAEDVRINFRKYYWTLTYVLNPSP